MIGVQFILEYEFCGDKLYNSHRCDLVEVCTSNETLNSKKNYNLDAKYSFSLIWRSYKCVRGKTYSLNVFLIFNYILTAKKLKQSP